MSSKDSSPLGVFVPDANDLRLEADLLDVLDNLKNKRPQRVILITMTGDNMQVWWRGVVNEFEAYGFCAMGLDWIRRKIRS